METELCEDDIPKLVRPDDLHVDFQAMCAELGIYINENTLTAIECDAVESASDSPFCCRRLDGGEGWRTWLKMWLSKRKYLRAKMRGTEDDIRYWVVLNVFPIHRDKVTLDGDDKIYCTSQVARSDIVKGMLVPRPVNGLAWKVARGAPPMRFDDLVREDLDDE